MWGGDRKGKAGEERPGRAFLAHGFRYRRDRRHAVSSGEDRVAQAARGHACVLVGGGADATRGRAGMCDGPLAKQSHIRRVMQIPLMCDCVVGRHRRLRALREHKHMGRAPQQSRH